MAIFVCRVIRKHCRKKCLRYIWELDPQLLLKISKIVAYKWFVSWKKLFWFWFWMAPPAQHVSGQPEDIQLSIQLCDLGTFALQTEKPNSISTLSHTPMGLAWTSAQRPLILHGFLESVTGKQWCSVLDVVHWMFFFALINNGKNKLLYRIKYLENRSKIRSRGEFVCREEWERGGAEIPATTPELTGRGSPGDPLVPEIYLVCRVIHKAAFYEAALI